MSCNIQKDYDHSINPDIYTKKLGFGLGICKALGGIFSTNNFY